MFVFLVLSAVILMMVCDIGITDEVRRPPLRARVVNLGLKIVSKGILYFTGYHKLTEHDVNMDYSEYLGPNYKKDNSV